MHFFFGKKKKIKVIWQLMHFSLPHVKSYLCPIIVVFHVFVSGGYVVILEVFPQLHITSGVCKVFELAGGGGVINGTTLSNSD